MLPPERAERVMATLALYSISLICENTHIHVVRRSADGASQLRKTTLLMQARPRRDPGETQAYKAVLSCVQQCVRWHVAHTQLHRTLDAASATLRLLTSLKYASTFLRNLCDTHTHTSKLSKL